MIAVGTLEYAILHLMGNEGTLRCIAMVAEPLISEVIIL
jgi:hypothetical protein